MHTGAIYTHVNASNAAAFNSGCSK